LNPLFARGFTEILFAVAAAADVQTPATTVNDRNDRILVFEQVADNPGLEVEAGRFFGFEIRRPKRWHPMLVFEGDVAFENVIPAFENAVVASTGCVRSIWVLAKPTKAPVESQKFHLEHSYPSRARSNRGIGNIRPQT